MDFVLSNVTYILLNRDFCKERDEIFKFLIIILVGKKRLYENTIFPLSREAMLKILECKKIIVTSIIITSFKFRLSFVKSLIINYFSSVQFCLYKRYRIRCYLSRKSIILSA